MRVSLFSSFENNPSIDRYAAELAAGFPDGVNTRVIKPAQSPGWKGKIYDRYLGYLRRAPGEQGDYNIVVSEGYGFLLLALDPRRTLVVCHDVHPLIYQGPAGTYRLRFKMNLRLMTRARIIATVSEHTRQDLLKYCPFVPPEKVAAVHNGLSRYWSPASAEEVAEFRRQRGFGERRFLLHVGNDNWYKNFAGLLRAFAQLQDPGLLLVKVGEIGADNAALVRQLELGERLVHVPRAQNDELRLFYSSAEMLAFPSLHEGFGWPPLEAMACACPVVTTRRASLPEVCGEACVYVDPKDPARIATSIESLRQDSGLRTRLVAAGFEQARKFDWRTTAQAMLRLLEEETVAVTAQ